MQTVLITGGTGAVGLATSRLLASQGYKVIHLSRKENLSAEFPAYSWDLEKQTIDKKALEQADFIIHLAGTGIADKRWTAARKAEIISSRVESSLLLARFLATMERKPHAVIGASAIGFYGNRQEETLDENSAAGTGFLAESCAQWENSYQHIRNLGIPCSVVRIGIVLDKKTGALSKMLPSYHVRLGAYFGGGKQIYSWIHIQDMARILLFLVQNHPKNQVYNATAPLPVSNRELAQTIADVLGKKSLIVPAPAFAMRIAMGEMADVVLYGSNVLPKSLESAGFEFLYPNVSAALENLLK
jgi:uncharacterized protein